MYVDFPVFGFMAEQVMMNNLSRLLINTIGMNIVELYARV